MEQTTNKSGMSTGAIIGIAFIVAIVFGGGAYAYVNNKAEKEKKDLNAQITELQSQISSATTATDETANWQTYTNTKYSYSVEYPSTWAYREFPSTVAGAGFRLSTEASDPANEFTSIGYHSRATQNANLPLDQYLKKEGAGAENYGDIVTIDKVTTDSGIVGYKVTWKVTSRDGKTTSTSNPYTYFPTADGKTVGMIVVSSLTVDDSAPYLADYGKMISTFKHTN